MEPLWSGGPQMNRREAIQNALAAALPANFSADVKTAVADETPLMIVITTRFPVSPEVRAEASRAIAKEAGNGSLKGVPVVVVDQGTTIDIIGQPQHSAAESARFARLEQMVTEMYQSHVAEKERAAETYARYMESYKKGLT